MPQREADEAELARYETALLHVLDRGGDTGAACEELAARAPAQAGYIQGFEPRMVALGMHLTAKWGRRC